MGALEPDTLSRAPVCSALTHSECVRNTYQSLADLGLGSGAGDRHLLQRLEQAVNFAAMCGRWEGEAGGLRGGQAVQEEGEGLTVHQAGDPREVPLYGSGIKGGGCVHGRS